jgi:hypothetical protein
VKIVTNLTGIALLVLVSTASSVATAQTKSATTNNLVEATLGYKASSENLLRLQEKELETESAKLAQLEELVNAGLVARKELDEGRQAVQELQAKIAATKHQIEGSDQLVAEIKAAEESAKIQLQRTANNSNSRNLSKPTILRYGGFNNWALTNLAQIQDFFVSKFGRGLPVSTIGQSVTHNRLGWDHRHAVDVALHPDSNEGKALINYLQSQGIPFLAFRGAVPGVSTGPHIHIGAPSHRLA